MSVARPLALAALCALAPLATCAVSPPASAEIPVFTDEEILEEPSYFRLRSIASRYTHYDQWGRGYQSRAGPMRGPGDETLTVEQPQIEAVVEQGADIVHRLWVPVDVVTAASPDAVDAVSAASQTNEAGALEWDITYGERTTTPLSVKGGFHGEENYRSYSFGLSGVLSLAEDNTVLQASGAQLLDWFDRYRFNGEHNGHNPRSATNASVGVTQILSPYTIGYLDYGLTYQQGQLSNGWNIVPYTDTRLLESLPASRVRSALTARVAEWLPWSGALKVSYRFYADDWGLLAHSAEFELDQRLHPYVYIGALYRVHTQSAVDFYTEHLRTLPVYRTADSDLAAFEAHTFGGKVALDVPLVFGFARRLHVDVEVERYVRTNNLEVMVYTCEVGLSR